MVDSEAISNSVDIPNFAKFGVRFQEVLVQAMLDERAFCDQISEVLDINFLEMKYLQVFVRKIFDYRERFKSHPSRETIVTIVKAELDSENELIQKQIREYFAKVLASTETEGLEYVKSTALDFCRKQKLREAMLKSVKLLKESSFDEISKLLNDALKLGSDTRFGYDYLLDFAERFQIQARNARATGWQPLDDITQGGLGSGELGVIISPSGIGKSFFLVRLGAQEILRGGTVVHYTLELSDTSIGSRYDSSITGFPLTEISSYKEDIFDVVKTIPGRLIIKEYPAKSATINTIKAHLDRLKNRGVIPTMIIVDYGDLLRPVKAQEKKYQDLGSIYEELRAIAQGLKVPLWTASQTSRNFLNAELITMDSIAESWAKVFPADVIFTVSRTVKEKQSKTGKIFLAKNRFGIDGIVFNAQIDFATGLIKIFEQTTESLEDIVAQSLQQSQEQLKKKYNEFKREKKNDV